MPKIRVNLLPKPEPRRKPRWALLFLMVLAGLMFLGLREAKAYSPAIHQLKDLQEKSRANLSDIDREMVQAYALTTQLKADDVTSKAADTVIGSALEKIDHLLDRKREETLRMDFMDKLIFKLAEHDGQNLRDSLPRIIDEMIQTELGIGARYADNDRSLIPFLISLSVALRTLPEPIENPLNFIEAYAQFSSIADPKPVSEFRSSQGYINEVPSDAKSADAKPADVKTPEPPSNPENYSARP
jgi:hypothetical protein